MCGIVGVLSLDGSRRPMGHDPEIEEMIELIEHRGPDELSYFADGHISLAAARLSIIDLPHGQQPMTDERGRYWIAYNGEVYNYREVRRALEQCGHSFRTQSDTEVVLRAWIEWGHDSPTRFDGGFAYAIYDRLERSCVLIRDRYGKRPLYYTFHQGSLVFASEMKALLGRGGFEFAWNEDELKSIFTIWTPIDGQTGFRGVQQVRAGTTLRARGDKVDERRFAGFPAPSTAQSMDVAQAADLVRERLDESVRLRLRSDVEVAVFLSGGLDSSIVTKLARDHVPGRLRTFSLRFADGDFDETSDQLAVSKWFGLDNTAITIGAAMIADNFADAVWHAEVPQFRTAFVPMYLLARRVHEEGIKVVLSGEGADEVFLGYDIFKETALRAMWNEMPAEMRRKRLGSLYPYLRHFSAENVASLAALFSRTSEGVEAPLFSHQIRIENSSLARRLLSGDAESDGTRPLAALVERIPQLSRLSPVQRAQWLEFHSLLQGYLLSTQSDRMLFAHGVEPRCPFLAPSVVELAATLPSDLLLSPDFDEKHVLKQAFRSDLPERTLTKPKWPYRAPDISAFVRQGATGNVLVDWVASALEPNALAVIGPLNHVAARRLVDKVARTPADRISPRENQAFILLLSLTVLNRQFVERRGSRGRPRGRRSITRIEYAEAS